MRWLRLLFRIFGWLLTPFLAWAASFFGAVGGALIAMQMDDPVRGLIATAVCGGVAGFLAIIGWLRYLRRSPEVREVLAVTEDGTPDTTDFRAVGIAVAGALALTSPAEAQTVGGSLGRFYEDGGWNTYRIGFSTVDGRLADVGVHGDFLERVGQTGGALGGLGIDVSAFRAPTGGPYLVAGLDAGLGAETSNGPTELWGSWSVGGGYQVFPASFFSVELEGRYRGISLGKRNGFQLSVGLGLHLGGRPRAAPPRRVPPPAAMPPVAAPPATRPPPSADRFRSAATLADSVIVTATAVMGRPYVWGGTGADGGGFDCSGLIQYAYGQHGVKLPRRSEEQARKGRGVAKRVEQLRAGDLLTFSNRGGRVTHVGLYLGDRRFIHSATRGVQVSVLSADDPYGRWWYTRWVGARRIAE